ncbi:MAG: response regulator [Verrucomicrobia bacterium]|nr:response regulator [Verrucomicrobiota bacterium]
MSDRHSLLQRQLRRLLDDEPPPEAWATLLDQVNEAYRAFDRDRRLLERSMEISSHELQQANADIRAVLDGLVDLYLRIDVSGRVLYLRGQTRHPILKQEQGLVGKTIQDLVVDEAAPAFQAMLERLQANAVVDEFSVRLGQGEEARHFDIHCVPAHHHQGSVIIRDITEASRAALREQKLQQRLARSERMESLGLLAGGVAHDLNNILSPLVSYPDIILSELNETSPIYRMVQKMQDSALRASAIIQDLLTLARRGNYQPEPVNLNDSIRTYLDSPEFHSLQSKYPLIELTQKLHTAPLVVEGSRHQLAQAVMNLITNAYEAIEGAGQVEVVTDWVQPGDQSTATETIALGPHAKLSVADTGVGMTQEQIEHIFEPFYTRKGTGKTGTGLGLSVVYGSVKDCQGTIKVYSTPGAGSRFDLLFPVSSQDAAHPQSKPRETTAPGGAVLLVVDDIPEQRELCMLLLQSRGFQVHAAAGGHQAIEFLQNHQVDLVLLDMIMEDDFDGLDTLLAIQSIKPDQPCLIVSGYAESDRVRRALDCGARGFVQKPFTLDVITRAVTRALETKPIRAD